MQLLQVAWARLIDVIYLNLAMTYVNFAVSVGVLGLLWIGLVLVLSKRRAGAAPTDREVPIRALTAEEFDERFGRLAFRPETEPGDHGKSHFCGRPWLLEAEQWPTCGICGEPMQLLLQLDLDHLPNGAPAQRSGGLAQLFYCTNETSRCELQPKPGEPFHPLAMARVVDLSLGGGQAPEDLASNPLPACTITGWEMVRDLPRLEQIEQSNVVLGEQVRNQLAVASAPHSGDKLGGWPSEVGVADSPCCSKCGDPMEFIFQLASDEHVSHPFEKNGPGHLMRCPRHSSIMVFGHAHA